MRVINHKRKEHTVNNMQTIRFFMLALTAYKHAKLHGSSYLVLDNSGVTQLALFIALDREAWRVTQFAIETKLLKMEEALK